MAMMTSHGKILLSVVVPVYNAGPYITDCLESLFRQGFKAGELQIICVNDGSTDQSAEILDKYYARSEIELVSTKNGGVSSARNIGLNLAKGKYLTFVDADDMLLPGALKQIVSYMEENVLDTASYPFLKIDECTGLRDMTQNEVLLSIDKNGKGREVSSSSACSFIIRRELVEKNHIRFNERMGYGEDTLFMYHVSMLLDPNKHCFVKEPIYCYRQNMQSVMHQKNLDTTHKHMEDMISMASAYQAILGQMESRDWKYANTKSRMDKATMAAMFDAARIPDIEPAGFLDQIRERGLYPINFQWWTLKPTGIKTWIFNLVCFLFPVPWYYIMFTRLIRKIKRR